MFNYYHVYHLDNYMGTVRALEESDAIRQVYMKTGSASAYTGASLKDYKAFKVGYAERLYRR